MDLAELTVAEGSARLASGSLRAGAWTEAVLDRIERLNGRLGAYITVVGSKARATAAAADAEIKARGQRSPLHGVPYGLKDCIATAGTRTTGHSRLFQDLVPEVDAAIAARLAAAGGILLGKHAMYELSYGGPSFDLPFPPARNPWNPERIPGGSSSGTAAAIAAGMGPAGIGTDAGGSIRQPSSFCGIAGLKPTMSLLPDAGILPMCFSLSEAGPMAWTVEDCAIILDVVARTDARAGLGRQLAGLRLGIDSSFLESRVPVAASVARMFERAVEALAGCGITVRETKLPDLALMDATGRVILLAEAFANQEAQLRADPGVFGRLARHRFTLGAFLSAADYVQALRSRERLIAAMSAVLDEVDVLMTLGERGGAPRFEDAGDSFPFTSEPSLRMPFSVSGHPALVVCAGFDDEGMPLAVQIVGRHGADDLVLAVGHALERALALRERRPTLPA